MDTILVAGGAGFIGSHIAKLLHGSGLKPVVLDNLSTGNRWAVKWGPLVTGEIGDRSLVHETIRKYKISAVIHLAASAYVGESVTNPRKYYNNNVTGSLAFLDALTDAGIQRVVFSSTCAVYGNALTDPIDEQHPTNPVNPYGESKLFIEKALRWLDSAHGLKSVSLRYFNAAGADPDTEIGEFHNPETHLIPLTLDAALGNGASLSVFGSDYPTPDGSAIRDYTHVCDLAQAHILALRYLNAGGETVSLNLGTGTGSSVWNVVRTVEATSGRPVSLDVKPRRVGDPARLVANAGAAAKRLGWIPRFVDLTPMIEHAWRWRTAENRELSLPWADAVSVALRNGCSDHPLTASGKAL